MSTAAHTSPCTPLPVVRKHQAHTMVRPLAQPGHGANLSQRPFTSALDLGTTRILGRTREMGRPMPSRGRGVGPAADLHPHLKLVCSLCTMRRRVASACTLTFGIVHARLTTRVPGGGSRASRWSGYGAGAGSSAVSSSLEAGGLGRGRGIAESNTMPMPGTSTSRSLYLSTHSTP